ncbi:MAG: hypothetical protein ACM3JD_11170 [Rudaea sp.]
MSAFGFDPFAEREPPPMSAELFAAVVVARLRSLPGIILETRRGLEFQLQVHGRPRTLHLDPYYRRYRREPHALTPLIQEFVESVGREEPASAPVGSFEQIAPHLFPMLISGAEWERKRAAGLRLVVRPLVRDLGIALVVDEPNGMTYVELGALANWELDIVSAYDTATGNLEGRARQAPVSEIGEGPARLLIERMPDGYAATRAILPSRLEEWTRRVEGELVLGLPDRNFSIGMSRNHPQLQELATQVARDAEAAGEQALLSHLLLYRDGVLQILS